MYSIAFDFFGRQIHWYGIFIALGFIAALIVLQCKRHYAKMTSDQIFDIGIIAIFGGLGGARLFYVIQFHEQFAGNFWKVFRIDQGGLVFYGGFLVAVGVLWVYSRIKHLSFARILDIYAPAIAMGHALGRIGCFMQGCCFGKPVSWGVVFPAGSAPAMRYPDLLSAQDSVMTFAGRVVSSVPSLPLYPVQLFEAAANLLLSIFLLLIFRFMKKSGQLAALYFGCYGLIRFLLEFLRGDHTDFIWGMTPAQFIGVFIMLPCGLICCLVFGKYGKDTILPSDHVRRPDSVEKKEKKA